MPEYGTAPSYIAIGGCLNQKELLKLELVVVRMFFIYIL